MMLHELFKRSISEYKINCHEIKYYCDSKYEMGPLRVHECGLDRPVSKKKK